MNKKCWRNERGSFTVEAALVFSVVIVCLALLCVAFMLLYHQVLLNKAASSIAQKAALMWVNSDQEELYYRIVDDSLLQNKTYRVVLGKESSTNEKTGSLVDKKLVEITEVARVELDRFIINPPETTIVINYSNNIFLRELSVELTQKVKTPFSTIMLTAQERAEIVEPVEYIRNIDLIFEYVEKAKEFDINRVKNIFQREANGKSEGEN